MTLKADWETGDVFTASDANDVADAVNQNTATTSYPASLANRDGSTDDRSILAAADTAAAAAGQFLLLYAGTHRVASDLTIASPVRLSPGAIIKPDNGITVTLDGGVATAPASQVFDHSAGGTVVPMHTPQLPVQWWGALGDTSNDDTSAIQGAIDAAAVSGATVVITGSGSGRFMVTQIRMKRGVTVEGGGWQLSQVRQIASTNAHMVVLDDTSVEMTALRNIILHGNKSVQTDSNSGVYYDNTGGSGFSWYDPCHVIDNVAIINTKSHGVYLDDSCRNTFMKNVVTHGCDGNGFYLTANDSSYVNLTAGGCGLSGFRINGGNSKYTACKSYGSGLSHATGDRHGWLIKFGRNTFVNCEAQDNYEHGFFIYPTSVWPITLTGCIADANGLDSSGLSPCGFVLYDAQKVKLQGISTDRNGTPHQKYGVAFLGTSLNNDVDVVTSNQLTASYSGISASSRVVINGANPYSGTATLVAGTKTVTDTAITANSVIRYWRTTTGGTLGNLSLSLSAGASFTITSDSATDTSVVRYEIESY